MALVLKIILGAATLVSIGAGYDWYYKKGSYQGWKYLVVHHSATDGGSAASFDRYHTQQGFGGLAYHFVIGNGSGSGDGEVEKGFRWKEQIAGTHVTINSWEYNIHGIGICLVGNFQKSQPTPKQWKALVDLSTELVIKHKIPIEKIIGHTHVPFDDGSGKTETTSCPGDKFPIDALKKAVGLAVKKKSRS